ncbi:fibronectin type III domain-containing protein [Streptacidiphilus fuscans]|uniref:Fibronectin type III domain-containing protein n=1 Tax=Streptacidiphilus fuscans TaxID=2789292 RepID=A0A931BAE5_9ACTN|nr:fibronectin type III domain-containing protein [Streptacidiphilus fuscans]MBF9069825.1 fibronectin type III domain-containing protein [Streptacidiphilus fuscans]
MPDPRNRTRAGLIGAATVLATAAALLLGTSAQATPGQPVYGLNKGQVQEQNRSQDVYVSVHGDDAAPGTADRPVRTLDRAQQLVRARDGDLTADLTVHLGPGTFRLDHPLTMDASDSGSNGHTVVWQGTGDTVLSGGLQVTGWRPVRGSAGLWSAPAPAGLVNTRQLYVDGQREERATGALPVTLTETPTGYTASSDVMSHWRDPSDIEFVYTGGTSAFNAQVEGLGNWTEPRCPIASISGTTITMAQPCWDNSTKRVMFPGSTRTVSMVGPASLSHNATPARVENAFELLTQPGQWYLDRSAHTVYYMPRAGQRLADADVEAPVLQQLVTADGTTQAPVHDLAFRNLRFEYATWLTPSSPEGFSEIQAGYTITGADGYATEGLCQFLSGSSVPAGTTPPATCPFGAWTKEPGNVSVQHGERVDFSGDVFTHLGAAGLDLGDGAQNDAVRGDVFTDISGNGVELGGVDQPLPTADADHTRGNQVTDNHLYGLPVEFHGGVAVLNGYSEDDVIAHNQIDHTPYTAISMGWGGWPDKIKVPATPNYSHDNQVSDNLIYDHMAVLDDGGGIYTQGITGTSMADGEKVTGNVIHDQYGFGKAVYTDNGCTYETVSGNVMYGVSFADVSARHTDYRDNLGNNDPTLISGNWWEEGTPDGDNKGLVTQGNHIIASPADAPAAVVAAAGIEPAYTWVLHERTAPAGVPGTPLLVGTFAADGSVYATWNPSYQENGSPVDSYALSATPVGGGQSVTARISAADFQRLGYAVIPGLTNGTAYSVTVAARNRVGTGDQSIPAAPVTPGPGSGALPGAVSGVSGYAAAGSVSLHWAVPATSGATNVIGYTVTVSDGRTIQVTGRDAVDTQQAGKAMFRVIGDLQPSTTYTFTVAAVTATGTGPASTTTVTTTAS